MPKSPSTPIGMCKQSLDLGGVEIGLLDTEVDDQRCRLFHITRPKSKVSENYFKTQSMTPFGEYLV